MRKPLILALFLSFSEKAEKLTLRRGAKCRSSDRLNTGQDFKTLHVYRNIEFLRENQTIAFSFS